MSLIVSQPDTGERVGDLERLLAGIRLRDDQFVDIDAQFPGIDRVERMLGVDEGGGAARLLRLGDDVEREGRLARAFRAVDLDDPAAGQAADTERDVEAERAGRHHLHLHLLARSQLHRAALAEGAVDLRQGGVEGFLLVHIVRSPVGNDFERCHHGARSPYWFRAAHSTRE